MRKSSPASASSNERPGPSGAESFARVASLPGADDTIKLGKRPGISFMFRLKVFIDLLSVLLNFLLNFSMLLCSTLLTSFSFLSLYAVRVSTLENVIMHMFVSD